MVPCLKLSRVKLYVYIYIYIYLFIYLFIACPLHYIFRDLVVPVMSDED